MAKRQQVLVLDPWNQLTFKGPFTDYVTSNIRLTNPSDRPVYFKVKTTAPRFYCVRPNSGVVKPSETAVINVMVQPVEKTSDLENDKARHKFMIQTAFAPEEEVSVDAFWKSVDPSEVMDSKLKVSFIFPTEEASGESQSKDVGPGGAASAAPVESHSIENTSSKVSTASVSASVNSVQQQANDHLLQKEIELRKMYQDEKNNLERENNVLLEKLNKLVQNSGNINIEGLPVLHVVLVAFLALLIGIILGKILF